MASPAHDRYDPSARDTAANTFLEAVEAGESVRDACKLAGAAWGSISRWLAADATLAARYARARTIAAHGYAERALNVALDANAENVQVARLQVDTLKWRAAVADPKTYSERKQVEHTGTVGHLHLDALRATSRIARNDNALLDTVASPPRVEAGKQHGDSDAPPIETTGIYPGWGDPIAPPSSE